MDTMMTQHLVVQTVNCGENNNDIPQSAMDSDDVKTTIHSVSQSSTSQHLRNR